MDMKTMSTADLTYLVKSFELGIANRSLDLKKARSKQEAALWAKRIADWKAGIEAAKAELATR